MITYICKTNKLLMQTYIAYYRVSTKEQGISQLGLKAQESAVNRVIQDGDIIATYTEVESGKNKKRPQLLKAIDECKKTGSILIVAKLDRLSRSASHIFALRDSKVDFVCANMPNVDSLSVGFMAIMAENEVKVISQRTAAALSEIQEIIKNKGFHVSKAGNVITTLGSPQNLTDEARAKGTATRIRNSRNNPNSKKAKALIIELRKNGMTLDAIASKLNELEFKAPRGGKFSKTQVNRLIKQN